MIRFMKAAAAAALLVSGLAPMTAPAASAQASSLLDYDSIEIPVADREGMVVSQNEIASYVGARVLEQGGNAFDAAVATALALAVTLPRAGNLGGSGFLLAYVAEEDKVIAIDDRSAAPAAAEMEMFLDREGNVTDEAGYGYKASAVPGTIAGLALAHEHYGSLPWEDLVQPALELARDGIVVSRDLSEALRWGRRRLETSPTTMETFFKEDGEPYQYGDTLVQPELAWTLERLATAGPEDFYTGEIAHKIADDMAANGGLITLEDLARYEAKFREPLRTTYRGYEVVTMPPSSSGGTALIEMLNMLETFNMGAMGHNSAASLHVMSEVMKLAYADRREYIGDPDFVDVPVDIITSKAFAQERVQDINREQSTPSPEIEPWDPMSFDSPDTTHFSIADQYGNVVSNTYTLGSSFGSGVVIDGAGFLLDNQMKNFSLRLNVRGATYGTNPYNKLEAGKRMLSSMTPTLVFRDGEPYMAVGSPGGSTIINTVLQVILNVVDHGMNIQDATEAPRIHQNWKPDELEFERGISVDTLRLLVGIGHEVELSKTIGSAQNLLIEDGLIYGAADPRRPDAKAVGVENLSVLMPEQQ